MAGTDDWSSLASGASFLAKPDSGTTELVIADLLSWNEDPPTTSGAVEEEASRDKVEAVLLDVMFDTRAFNVATG